MSTRPILIDYYCGAGGAAKGWRRAGFYVIGVDKDPQPNYCGDLFYREDVFEFHERLERQIRAGGMNVVAFHASPPCQHDSNASKAHNGKPESHPDLIGPTQEILRKTGKPYVIENVAGARRKLKDPIMLCGTMFPGLRVTRHRYFECHGFNVWVPPHGKHPLHYTLDKRKPHYGKLDEMKNFVMVNGGGNCSKAAAADAMGIDWMQTKHELNEAIPPLYTQHIGFYLMRAVEARMAA